MGPYHTQNDHYGATTENGTRHISQLPIAQEKSRAATAAAMSRPEGSAPAGGQERLGRLAGSYLY